MLALTIAFGSERCEMFGAQRDVLNLWMVKGSVPTFGYVPLKGGNALLTIHGGNTPFVDLKVKMHHA